MNEQSQTDGEQLNEDELEDVNGGFNMYANVQKVLRNKAGTATDGASQAQSGQ